MNNINMLQDEKTNQAPHIRVKSKFFYKKSFKDTTCTFSIRHYPQNLMAGRLCPAMAAQTARDVKDIKKIVDKAWSWFLCQEYSPEKLLKVRNSLYRLKIPADMMSLLLNVMKDTSRQLENDAYFASWILEDPLRIMDDIYKEILGPKISSEVIKLLSLLEQPPLSFSKGVVGFGVLVSPMILWYIIELIAPNFLKRHLQTYLIAWAVSELASL